MEIIGKLVQKLERETGVSKSGKTWEKQSILVEQSGTEEGSEVNISINLSSREFNGKYYHNIDGWFCAKLGQETISPVNNEDLPF